jgi:hypothetical protein
MQFSEEQSCRKFLFGGLTGDDGSEDKEGDADENTEPTQSSDS